VVDDDIHDWRAEPEEDEGVARFPHRTIGGGHIERAFSGIFSPLRGKTLLVKTLAPFVNVPFENHP
jgi:hypothetical protein